MSGFHDAVYSDAYTANGTKKKVNHRFFFFGHVHTNLTRLVSRGFLDPGLECSAVVREQGHGGQ